MQHADVPCSTREGGGEVIDLTLKMRLIQIVDIFRRGGGGVCTVCTDGKVKALVMAQLDAKSSSHTHIVRTH